MKWGAKEGVKIYRMILGNFEIVKPEKLYATVAASHDCCKQLPITTDTIDFRCRKEDTATVTAATSSALTDGASAVLVKNPCDHLSIKHTRRAHIQSTHRAHTDSTHTHTFSALSTLSTPSTISKLTFVHTISSCGTRYHHHFVCVYRFPD